VTTIASFADCPTDQRGAVTRLFFDVDDTLTWRGELPHAACAALYDARAAGLSLVAVTGRSFAWAELLVRMFPFDAAIAETGALCLVKLPGGRVVVDHAEPDPAARARNDDVKRRAAARVLAEVEGARLALDNPGRVYDVAFDLVEDGPPVSDEDARRIRAILESEGLTTARSSVHVNAWIGRFDKASMVDRYLRERCGTSLAAASSTLCYVGDSTNDGPLFAAAGLPVGVANVAPHLPALTTTGQAPRYVVDQPGGHGFAQVVELLLAARARP
jgi:HAD superfamily hydrolase (TIGR01484 family)